MSNLLSQTELNLTASPRRPVAASQIDWTKVKRVLVVRLRSIGDTVLSTPSLIALRRFLPEAQIDILLEDWVAPLLEDFDAVDNVIAVPTKNSVPVDKDKMSRKDLLFWRSAVALSLRETKYDVAFNLHGGTTATFFVRASGARHRVGFKNYQYNFLYNHLLSSSSDFWGKKITHSAEQQLALLGFVGVPVADEPKSRLIISEKEAEEMDLFLHVYGIDEEKIALIHPAAAFETKRWSAENFAKVIDYLDARGICSVAVAAPNEENIIKELSEKTKTIFHGFTHLTLPEIKALASRAKIFIGNDSGVAHIAAAVNTPTVVIFGASNFNHWRPWTNAPNEIVYAPEKCNHALAEIAKGSENPKCILCVKVIDVCNAIEKALKEHT